MEITDLTLGIARLAVLALMYLLVMVLIGALRADARAAAGAASRPTPLPPTTPEPAPAATKPLVLMVTTGTMPTSGREYQLNRPLEIGRGGNNDIVIPNTFVSTQHARVYSAAGQWLIDDLGSTNGTLYNGKPLAGAQTLQRGDRVVIGDTEFVIQ